MVNEINSFFRTSIVGRLSTFMFQLNHKNSDNIIGGTIGAERKQTVDSE